MLKLVDYIDHHILSQEEEKLVGDVVKQSSKLRFVVVNNEDAFVLLIQTAGECQHKSMVEDLQYSFPKATLLGAGSILGGTHPSVVYGSDTCRQAFGFDQPGDPKAARELLEHVVWAIVRP